MAIPVLLHVASASQALPLGVGLIARGRPLPAPVRWVLVWCAVNLASDASLLWLAFARGENIWLLYVTTPASGATALWALSGWQSNEFWRVSYRAGVVILLVVAVAVAVTVPQSTMFDQLVAPLHDLVVLVAALHTLVHLTLRSSMAITQEEWFWITLGMALYFAASVAIRPFAQALVVSQPDWVRAAYLVRAGIQTLAFTLVAWGVFWPSYSRRFGGHS